MFVDYGYVAYSNPADGCPKLRPGFRSGLRVVPHARHDEVPRGGHYIEGNVAVAFSNSAITPVRGRELVRGVVVFLRGWKAA